MSTTSFAKDKKLGVDIISIISTEINWINNLFGSYNDVAELMILAAKGIKSSSVRRAEVTKVQILSAELRKTI